MSAQDGFSALSHERAATAIKDGRFADEIVAVSVPQRKGDPIVVDTDEGVRPGTTAESLGALKPAFDKEGTITAGNASQISDGGAAVVVTSRARADALGVTPLGEVVSYGQVAGPDASLLLQPANAIVQALAKAGKTPSPTCRPVRDQRGVRRRRPGLDGRARHHRRGRPMSTAGPSPWATPSACRVPAWRSRCSTSCERRGGGLGAASLCGGGGQGDALVVRSLG